MITLKAHCWSLSSFIVFDQSKILLTDPLASTNANGVAPLKMSLRSFFHHAVFVKSTEMISFLWTFLHPFLPWVCPPFPRFAYEFIVLMGLISVLMKLHGISDMLNFKRHSYPQPCFHCSSGKKNLQRMGPFHWNHDFHLTTQEICSMGSLADVVHHSVHL